MRPSTDMPRSRRRRHTAPPTEASKEQHESEVASIETGLKLLQIYTSALEELKERGQSASGDIKLALELRHAPRDWSNTEILSVMADIIDEHPKPKLEFVLGVLGLSKVPENLDDRLRSKGAKAYSSSVRNRALRRKKEAKEKEERERREKKEREERERREKKEREEKQRREKERLEKERLEKERLEKERLEKERREKERLEKEQLEKEQIEKERREKERLEKEKLEMEKAEEAKKNAALKKESEAKRGGGKVRRGRRGRPQTRVGATERAKNADGDQAVSRAKVLMEQPQQKAKDVDAMEVDANGVKQDAVAKKMSSMDPNAEAMQKNIIAGGPNAGAEEMKSAMPTKPVPSVPPASLPRPEEKNVAQKTKSAESKGQRTTEVPKEEPRLQKDVGTAGPKSDTLPKRGVDQTESGGKAIPTKESIAKTEGTRILQVHRNHKAQAAKIETRRHPDASKVRPRHEEPKVVARGKPENVRDGERKSLEPVLEAASAGEKPRAADAQVRQPHAAHAPASNKVIVEAKIASALKESAAAVNREMPERHLDSSVSLKPFSVVGEGSGADELQPPGEKEVSAVPETVEETRTLQPAAVNEVRETGEAAKAIPKATKEPIPRRPAIQAPKESRAVDEKVKGTDSAKKSVDKSKRKEKDTEATVAARKAEQSAAIVAEHAKEETEPVDDTEKASVSPKESDISKDKVEAAKRDDVTKAGDSQEREKEPEQEAEDFMADVFGPEDGDGEKDDTEEGDVEKRGLRYRSRGRRSDEDEGEAHGLTDKGSMFVESEDESESKDTRKRGRATGVARRTSRRVSNIRDEIVIAPTGRRMRRESRNLINGAWQLPNTDEYLVECVEVWERLHGNRITIPFREPVTAKDAPGYFDIVKNPMDMGTVKEMLQDGRISSPDEFYKQMKLICSNALLFNDEDSDLHELASELLEMIRKDTKPIVKGWRESRGLDAEESESESEAESQRKRTKGRAKKKGSKSKSKTKSKGTTEKRKRLREDDGGGKSKKRRTSRRTAKREDEE